MKSRPRSSLRPAAESPHVAIGIGSVLDTPETHPARLSFEAPATPPSVPLIVSPPMAPEMPAHRLGSESIDWDSGVAVTKSCGMLLPVLPEEEEERAAYLRTDRDRAGHHLGWRRRHGVGHVAENTTAVTTVTATDSDAGATLTYSIVGGADAAKFTIDANTGVLAFITAPDYETPTDAGGDNVYDVTVQVSDGTLTDTQAIAATVTTINDDVPVITSDGAGATASVNVAENTTAVTTVTATDPDAGATLTYSIIGGADAAMFTINASTGVLSSSPRPTSRPRPTPAATMSTTSPSRSPTAP